MRIIGYQSVNGMRWQLCEGLCIVGVFKSYEEANMVEVEGSKYDYERGVVSLDGLARLDEPEQLLRELERIAEDNAKRNPRSDGWRFVAKWAKEANEELAKSQEPPSR